MRAAVVVVVMMLMVVLVMLMELVELVLVALARPAPVLYSPPTERFMGGEVVNTQGTTAQRVVD